MKATSILLALGLLVACSPEPSHDGNSLRIALLPDRSAADLRARNAPLVEHLESRLGVEVELIIPESFEAHLELFAAGRTDLAWFGGLTFLLAERASGAVPLVMRDIDLEFTSDFLATRSFEGWDLEDFEGQRLLFGPRLSTSGHLMPRYFLHEQGIDPETFFGQVDYSSGHDRTAASVRDGDADLGTVNSLVSTALFESGELSGQDVWLVGRTPPFRNYLWATRKDLDEELRAGLLDAFLALDRDIPWSEPIIAPFGATTFLPVSRGDYDELRRAAAQVGVLDPEAGD